LRFSKKYIQQHLNSPFLLLFCDYLQLCESALTKKILAKEINKLVVKMIALSKGDATLNRLCGYINLVDWLQKTHEIK
jgi:hypothetical protein